MIWMNLTNGLRKGYTGEIKIADTYLQKFLEPEKSGFCFLAN